MGGCIGPETVIVTWFWREYFVLGEYFTLGGCCGPESVYFSLGGCVCPEMSNAVTAVIVTPLSLDLATWLGGRGCELLKYHKLLQAHFPQGLECFCPVMLVTTRLVSASLDPGGPKFLLGVGCVLLHLAGMCLTLVTGSLSNLVCFLGLKALLSGTMVSAM